MSDQPLTTSANRVRHHPVPGLYNLRDVGGYPAEAGATRWGKLFRSDGLHQLDNTGRRILSELGIAHIVDLRRADERRDAPSRVDGVGARMHLCPIFADAAPLSRTRLSLAKLYDHIVDARGPRLASAIRVIAEAGANQAVLVHCTAGKDRTGLVIAFALLAAGVHRAEVVADYAASADYLRGEWTEVMLAEAAAGVNELPEETVALITTSPAATLSALLERIDREHGSIRSYLQAQGLTAAELDRLRTVLIADHSASEHSASDHTPADHPEKEGTACHSTLTPST